MKIILLAAVLLNLWMEGAEADGTVTTTTPPEKKPPCDPSFCEGCYFFCGHPPYLECDGLACMVSSICHACEYACQKQNGTCPGGACDYVHKECPICPNAVDWKCGDDFRQCGGDGTGSPRDICLCDVDTEGNPFCWQNAFCRNLTSCDSSDDCDPGTRCATTCCSPKDAIGSGPKGDCLRECDDLSLDNPNGLLSPFGATVDQGECEPSAFDSCE